MKSTLYLIALSLLIVTGLLAQTFTFTNRISTEAFKPIALSGLGILSKKETTLELKDGKLYVTHSTHESCFAATIPGCSGHDKTWRDVYSASNGIVVLERTINQVLVTRTNVTTTQTYEWPE